MRKLANLSLFLASAYGQVPIDDDIRDRLELIAPDPPPDPEEIPAAVIVVAVVLLLGLIALFFIVLRRRRRRRVVDPDRILEARLEALRTELMPARRLYGELRETLADYLETRLGLRVRACTSAELAHTLGALGIEGGQLRAFLRAADEAQYCRAVDEPVDLTVQQRAVEQCEWIILRAAIVPRIAVMSHAAI